MRYEEYALLTGYRQLINEGYLNPQDSRMVPKTFEGVTTRGTIGPVDYNVGYLTAIKLRQQDEFHNMAEAASVAGDKDRGLVLTRLSSEPVAGLSLYVANYLVPDVFNTVYGFGEYVHDVTSNLSFKTGLQATDQRSVGAAFLGNFTTWNAKYPADSHLAGARGRRWRQRDGGGVGAADALWRPTRLLHLLVEQFR